MWHALRDYADGIFHEPRFYGQSYNTMLEALLAIPFYKTGMSAFKALPLITSILTLFPYILISFFTFIKKSKKTALIILTIPLLLPIEYSLITSLSRGFVTGIFFASIGSISLFYPHKKWSLFMMGFLGVIGFSVNANSILISGPCLFYLFLENSRDRLFYIFSGIGIILGSALHYLINYFYIANPYYNLHGYDLSFSFAFLWKGIGYMDRFLNDVSPIFWKQGYMVLFLFVLASVILFRKRKSTMGLFLISLPLVVILTFGFNKIHDGSNSIFFPYSRMYLSIPVMVGIALSFAKIRRKYCYLYFAVPLGLLIFNIYCLNDKITENLNPLLTDVVTRNEVSVIIEECDALMNICEQNNVELILISKYDNFNFINYGCSTCIDNFPNTLLPNYERRTWRLLEDEYKVYPNILILDIENNLNKKFNFIQKIEGSENIYLIQNNDLTTKVLMDKIGIKVRQYK